ncbi:MAG: polysaccharide biosynthesis C-terminal domain-containing protein [Lachnospiraceae bacterium]|nr:polysaccharide biosynthesis C-terminal domain-containing protein [Lachnospiraceae bacterium]
MQSDQKMLKRIYYKALFPSMVAILGGTVNVFFDGIMVGQRMGETGIASVNQSLAVYLLLCMLGSLLAAGSSVLSAAAMGGDRQQEGRDYYCMAVETAFFAGLVLCGIGFAFSARLAHFLGSADTWQLVESYIRVTFLGGTFKILLYVPYYYLRLEGRTKQAAIAMTMMTVLNIVLDYLFLFVFDLGIAGAAWASNIGTAVACVMSFYFLSGKNSGFRFRPVRPKRKMLLEAMRTGSPLALNNLLSSLRLISLNSIMNIAGGSTMVAAFAITNNLNEFSICVQNGVPQAGSAMLGIYNGEQDVPSVRKLLLLQLRMGAICASVFAAFLLFFRGQMGSLFGTELDVRFPVACLAVGIVLGTLNSVMSYYYFAVMNTGMANLITVLRVFVAPVLTARLLQSSGAGIWLFYGISELATAILWTGVAALYSRRQKGKADLYLLDDTALREGKSINFTVACDTEAICGASERITEFCEASGFDAEQTMTISLALEELMVITAEKSMDNQGSMDVRILKLPEGGILRIRSEGRHYNPLELADDSLEYLGVNMIMQMAKKTEYQSVLGLNTLVVHI